MKRTQVRNVQLDIGCLCMGKNVSNHDGKLDVVIFVCVWIVEVCGSIIQKEMTGGLFRMFRIDSMETKDR